MYNEMSVTLISVSHDTVVSNKHEERTRHYYVIFQQTSLLPFTWKILFNALDLCSQLIRVCVSDLMTTEGHLTNSSWSHMLCTWPQFAASGTLALGTGF